MAGKIYTASMRTPNRGGLSGGAQPWWDPFVAQQAINTALAGRILQDAMAKSRGAMGLGGKV